MAFQLDFPGGWKTGNSKEAVQAGSAEGDAIMALSLGEGASPSAALSTFLSHEGMEAGPSSNAAINGVPAAAADFRFTSTDGVLQGRVVFLSHGGTVLQFLGVAPASAWAARRSAVRASLESFSVLTDRSKLDLQPARIRILTVPREMSLSAFLERQGAGDRTEHVRLLNRLQGDPVLTAGRTLKVPLGGFLPGGE
jgi:predicted Zn-dependent protease